MASFDGSLLKNEHCEQLSRPDLLNFVISWLILAGILISYLPQHYKIISRRSSEGLSPYFVLLGATSGTCAIANILLLPTSREDIACCKVINGFSCTAALLGIAQIGVQWGCFFFISFLYIVFIPRNTLFERGNLSNVIPSNDSWRKALAVFSFSIAFFIIVLIISVVVLGAFPSHLRTWAELLGTLGAILASIQYIPQIYMTWNRGTVGSLSVHMMCIQTPGSFVFVGSLAARLGKKGWSAWTVYLVTGILQGILLGMALSFNYRDRKRARMLAADDQSETGSRETDALLPRRAQNQDRQRGSLHNGVLNGSSDKPPTRTSTEFYDAASRRHSRAESSDTVIGPSKDDQAISTTEGHESGLSQNGQERPVSPRPKVKAGTTRRAPKKDKAAKAKAGGTL